MKNILIIFTLLFSMMFPYKSFAGWTKVSTNVSGINFYVDFEGIKRRGNKIYYWEMSDYLTPQTDAGILSAKKYVLLDCNIEGYKVLSWIWYRESMGKGNVFHTNSTPDKDWKFDPPGSSGDIIVKRLCN